MTRARSCVVASAWCRLQASPTIDSMLSRSPRVHRAALGLFLFILSGCATTVERHVQAPPASLGLDPFYAKYVEASGYPIIASAAVNDYALLEAAYLVDMMLARRPDVRAAILAEALPERARRLWVIRSDSPKKSVQRAATPSRPARPASW